MRRYFSTISIILLFILILTVYLAGWPKYLEFKDLELELQRKSAAIKQKEDYYSSLTELSIKLEKYRQELNQIDTALPGEIFEPDILNFLEKKALANGLVLKTIHSSPSSQGQNNLSKTSFYLELSGFYPYFKNYLLDIYRNSRLFEVETISFSSPTLVSSAPFSQQTPIFNFKLTLSVYYKK